MRSLFAIATLGFAAQPTVGTPIPTPAADEAIFFFNQGFEGESLSIKVGQTFPLVFQYNRQMSSIALGKDITVQICGEIGC